MRRNLLMLLACISMLSAWADLPFRNHRYDSFKVLEPAEGSIVFIGNSITDMHCWPEAFMTSEGKYLPIVNRGNSGTYSTEQSENLESYLGNKPKKVFMMIGTNDLASSGGLNFSAQQILANVKSIVERIHTRYPDTKVYLYSILNNRTSNREEARWLETNRLVKEYVTQTGEDWLTYIDLYNTLYEVGNGGAWSYDYLHLTAGSYREWCEVICKYLQKGESYTVHTVYPAETLTKQNSGTMSGSHGMRATYFSMLPVNSEDVLVFGDELVKNGEWQELLGNPNVKNRGTGWGYGGDIATTSNIVQATYANTGVTKKSPKAIFLYTGTADANGSTALQTVKDSYKALVEKIKGYAPSSVIYLMGLCPTKNATTNTNRISALNTYIKSLAGDKVKYIDTYSPLISGSVANTQYFYPDNYLGGLGYVKVASLMQQALAEDFPADTYTVVSEEAAQKRYEQATLRNQISQLIAQGLSVEMGTDVGQYDAEKMSVFNAEVTKAYALLTRKDITKEEVNTQVEALTASLLSALVMPKASTDEATYWYQFTSLRSPELYVSTSGASAGVVGSQSEKEYATSMWKFVARENNTFDIVNREYDCYLNPVASYNSQVKTTATRPDKGWTISYSNTAGYYIISAGDVQLNQTGSGQNYAIYNWSAQTSLGQDRNDQGCQLKIMVAEEPVEKDETVEDLEYIIDKTNGDLYRGTSVNQSWNSVWKSKKNPQLQFSCGVNNMTWSGNQVEMMTGTAGSSNYVLTAPTGYFIEEYSFTFANNNHTTALTLTMDNGKVYTTKEAEQTISAKGQRISSMSFVLAGNNGKGVVLSDFVVKIKEDKIERPLLSKEGEEHWYYIVSAATNDYCKNKVIYYDSETGNLRFANKSFSANYIWSFWEKDGKLAIKNYNGEYFGTAGNGTGGTTAFGVVDKANHIYTIEESYGSFIIKDSAVELHAQEAGQIIVRWSAAAGNASLWKFEEVDVSQPEAVVSNTVVVQGKVSTGIGNKNQPIVRSTISVSGLTGSVRLQSVKGAFVGTDKADVSNVKAYFATNSRELFIDSEDRKMDWREENGELFGEPVALSADGTFSISGEKVLAPGNHYLWITYDIADDAQEGHTVDAQIQSYTIDGKVLNEENGNPPHQVTIFLSEGAVLMPMDKGSLYYRIPSITVTTDGTRLVTLTDDRKNHNSDLPSHCYLVAQYSEDNGRTWSEPKTVAGTAETGGDYGHGDASIVTNRDNGEIVGIMTSAGTYGHGFFAGTSEQPPRWKTITSRDGGLTWDAPVDHTDDLFGAKCDNPKTKTWKSGFSGSGAALQKRDGTLVSSFVNRQADNSQHFYFFMSKDGGKNWYVSGNSGTSGADEPKTLERNNGDLAISVRSSGYNYYNFTSDDGETWHKPSQTRFTTGISGNACDGEYMVWCSTVEGNPWDIALQTLPNSSSRQNVSIALSTDEGATFGSPKTICPRGSAYSAAVVLPDGTLGVYYEENGVFGGYTMRFVRFSLNWASDGKYKFTKDAPFHPIKSTNTTGIEEVISTTTEADAAIYDLQGRRLTSPTAPGIYIRNGKKVFIK
ncbi:MAG: exo-alpha-sialidase [Bacteroidaceae bacterium]|nr:exo-alpha-sialidase [Bacteroidaceae bacterium]